MKAKAKAAAAADDGAESPSAPLAKKRKVEKPSADLPESADPPAPPPITPKGRSPRTDRLERQGKLLAKLAPHVPPGGRGKGNGKKKGLGDKGKPGNGKWQDDRGKRQKKNNDAAKPLQIFD
jgi:hypothetical protein